MDWSRFKVRPYGPILFWENWRSIRVALQPPPRPAPPRHRKFWIRIRSRSFNKISIQVLVFLDKKYGYVEPDTFRKLPWVLFQPNLARAADLGGAQWTSSNLKKNWPEPSSGSRISRREHWPSRGRGEATVYFANVSQKSHEIEEKFDHRGARSGRPS